MKRPAQPIDQQIARLAWLTSVFSWPVAYAMSIGVSAWAWRHREQLSTLAKNRLAHEQRIEMLRWIGVAAGAVFFVYLLAIVVHRIVAKRVVVLTVAGELNRRMLAILGLPFVASIWGSSTEATEPIWTALVATFAAIPVAASAYFWRRPNAPDPDPERAGGLARARRVAVPLLCGLTLLALWAAYGFFLSRFAVGNHHALNTRTIDLGYYDNVFYNSSHGRPLGCTFVKGGNHSSAHFDPILVLLSPLYLLYPRAEMLLVLQSVWLGMGVVPTYLLAKTTLNSRLAGIVLAVCYALYPALHGANLYEFHSLTLIAPLVLWLFYFLEQKKWIGYGAMLLLLCLCREDVPLMLCFVGLYAAVSGRVGYGRVGAITIGFCILYFVVARQVFMPSKELLNTGDKAYSYAYYFDELIPNKRGVGDLALSLVTNPLYVLKLIFGDQQKILYLLVLFVPLGLFPLFAGRARWLLVYGLAVCLLATRKPVFQIGFQYAAMIFPFAFAIVPRAVRDLTEDARLHGLGLEPKGVERAAFAFMLAASLAISWKFGVFLENSAFRGGFGRIARWPLTPAQGQQYAELREVLALIEPGASVLVTNRIGAHVSNRKEVYLFHQRKGTHYVLAEERELSKQKAWHEDRVRKGELELVKRVGPFALWKAVTNR